MDEQLGITGHVPAADAAVAGRGAPSARAAADRQRETLLRRIRGEYWEMPGLALTLKQAERLWNLERRECADLLDHLVDAGFLACTSLGMFVRADSGRLSA